MPEIWKNCIKPKRGELKLQCYKLISCAENVDGEGHLQICHNMGLTDEVRSPLILVSKDREQENTYIF
jgi:hypothetical protein